MSSIAFERWGQGFSGCDGGDLGTPARRSIWVCGIEWGGGHTPAELQEDIEVDVGQPRKGYDDFNENLAYIFNRQTLKLLSAVSGKQVEEYEATASEIQPFVAGQRGFFKMNLFPIAFKKTSRELWRAEFAKITGFEDKDRYLEWCRNIRFPIMRSWVLAFRPKLIICFGKTYVRDFLAAFAASTDQVTTESLLDRRELSWTITADDVLVAVCPFPVNRYGLNSNRLLQAFGERIRAILAERTAPTSPPGPETRTQENS